MALAKLDEPARKKIVEAAARQEQQQVQQEGQGDAVAALAARQLSAPTRARAIATDITGGDAGDDGGEGSRPPGLNDAIGSDADALDLMHADLEGLIDREVEEEDGTALRTLLEKDSREAAARP